ncbi:MAG TPA: TIR domain-containing protein [Candidatus Didemnitutus sp.]|nr:TIR domain-containing protein [Candidatus Didemnitutus sp.]
MSEPFKAVFLSYASQDAEAAKRICEALRAAGIEVWFDQSELRGGDAWDQKIRRQIRECALFVPIISPNTDARPEGYFRLEWKLAVDRSHLLADDHPFLFPIAIGDVKDATARVPDRFRDVQWTRLRMEETPVELAARVSRLLETGRVSSTNEKGTSDSSAAKAGFGDPALHPGGKRMKRDDRPPWLRYAWSVVGLVLALYYGIISPVWRTKNRNPADNHKPVPAATVPDDNDEQEGAEEIAAVRAKLRPDSWTRADFEAFSASVDRLIKDYPENGEAWALRGIANSLLVIRNLDSGTKPLEVGREAAERALRLAPKSPYAELSLGLHQVAMISRGSDARVPRERIDHAFAQLPKTPLTRYAEVTSYWLGYQFEGSEKSCLAWLQAEPKASFPAWILAQLHVVRREPDEAIKWSEQASSDPDITGTRALVTMFEATYYLKGDLAASRAVLDRIPPGQRTVHRVLACRWLLAMAEKQYDQALQELNRLPESMMRDRIYHGPKALLAGLAHAAAGRTDVAQGQFATAERELRDELGQDPDNEELRAVLALDLACLGRSDDAKRELSVVEPLLSGQDPSVYVSQPVALVAQAHVVLNDIEGAMPWLKRLLTQPSSLTFNLTSLAQDPRFGSVATDPRVLALAGNPPAVASAVDSHSIAVLAFANLSDDKANEYFSDGISEELLNVLAKIPALKVAARTSAFYFKGKDTPIPEIARQLGVAYVVEGSVRRQGTKVRITAQLIKAADGFHVWSDTFTRELKDIFAVQDEIAGLVAQNLELKIGAATAPAREVNPEAYEAYLAGRSAEARADMPSLLQAVKSYERAVAIDPKLAAAWIQLAATHLQLGRWGGAPTTESWREARTAIDRAQELEPDSPDMLVALGWIRRTCDWNWKGAEQAFRRAMALRPGHAETLSGAAVLLFNIGKTAEAFQFAKEAVRLDPLNPSAQIDLSIMFALSHDWAEAEKTTRRALELAPAGVGYHSILAWSMIMSKRYAEADAEIARDTDIVEKANASGQLAIARGDRAGAQRALAQLQEVARTNPDASDLQQSIAWICAPLGDADAAFAALERSRASRDPSMSWLRNSIFLEPLYSDPRWNVLLHQIGLADDQLK